MINAKRLFYPALLLGILNGSLHADSSAVLRAMKLELARSAKMLSQQSVPPYFMSYEITQTDELYVSGSVGTLTRSAESHGRILGVEVRVGTPALDNTHPMVGNAPGYLLPSKGSGIEVPVDDDPIPVRTLLWYQTDRAYKEALEQYSKVRAQNEVGREQDDQSADFSEEAVESFSEPVVDLKSEKSAWEDKVRSYTAPFARESDIGEGSAIFVALVKTRWYVNTDGAVLQTCQPSFRLYIRAMIRAEDGMELPLSQTYWASSEAHLPPRDTVLKAIQKIIKDLQGLKAAPVLGPYVGPAILSGRASAVFFHEVFGHRVEGSRLKLDYEGQTFKHKIGEQVLPPSLSVYFDPNVKQVSGQDLAGHYVYDDEGVKAQRVVIVENGILRNFLMSRTPIEGSSGSNGHGRGQDGLKPTARQSSLFVSVADPVRPQDLKKMLIDLLIKENKPFGLFFDDIVGGFTLTRRTMPNAFNVMPLMVYRIYQDGREELVRGVDMIGTPLTAFTNVIAAGDDVSVFNGLCVADSGAIPTSAVSPSILLSQIEVQQKAKMHATLPLYSTPEDNPW